MGLIGEHIMVDSTSLGGGGVAIGDVISTARTTTEAGNVLLPVTSSPRPLSVAEQSAYPLLTAALPDRWGVTQMIASHLAGSINTTSQSHIVKCSADGQDMYYSDGASLVKFDGATQNSTTILTDGDNIVNFDISADGTTIAAIAISGTVVRVSASNDSGSSFSLVHTSGSSGNNNLDYLGAIKVSGDGDTVSWITCGNTGADVFYQRIDGALASLTVDVTTDITAGLGGQVVKLRGGLSNDGQSFFVVIRNNADGIFRHYYSNDAGVTITEKKPPSTDPITKSTTDYNLLDCVVDEVNPNILVSLALGIANTGAMHTISFDAGTTWREIPSPNSYTNRPFLQGGAYYNISSVRQPMKCNNGHLFMNSAYAELFYFYIDAAKGTVELVGSVFESFTNAGNNTSMFGIGISENGLTGGICALTGNNEYPWTNGQMKLGATVPASSGSNSLKLVADAP